MSIQILDYSLSAFQIPGIAQYSPLFGTKKPEGSGLTTEEITKNEMMPFVKQRSISGAPILPGDNPPMGVIMQDSIAQPIEFDAVFSVGEGVTLQLADPSYEGQIVRIVASFESGSFAVIVLGLTGTPESISLNGGDAAVLLAVNGKWKKYLNTNNLYASQIEGLGRNLLDVLGAATIPDAMAEIRRRCNNNGEIDASGVPDFSGIMIGDYIDGIDLSAVEAHAGGTAGQAWSDIYKNNRIVVSGFNTYKGAGNIEITKNHILFSFRNIPLLHRMNFTNDNAGGYPASELRVWLEGANGDGTGALPSDGTVPVAAFLNALKDQIGDYLYTINKSHSIKESYSWGNYTLWPPSELEVFGFPISGDEGVIMPAITAPAIAARVGNIMPVQFPIFRDGYAYRIKMYNGVRAGWWELTPYTNNNGNYAIVYPNGPGYLMDSSNAAVGVAPAFCVA